MLLFYSGADRPKSAVGSEDYCRYRRRMSFD